MAKSAIATVSLFQLAKTIKDTDNGTLNNVTTFSSGFVLLECHNTNQSKVFPATKSLNNISVEITPHKSFNFTSSAVKNYIHAQMLKSWQD